MARQPIDEVEGSVSSLTFSSTFHDGSIGRGLALPVPSSVRPGCARGMARGAAIGET